MAGQHHPSTTFLPAASKILATQKYWGGCGQAIKQTMRKLCYRNWQSRPAWLGPLLHRQGVTALLADERTHSFGRPGCSQPLEMPPAICHHFTAAQQILPWKNLQCSFPIAVAQTKTSNAAGRLASFLVPLSHAAGENRRDAHTLHVAGVPLTSIPTWEICNNPGVTVALFWSRISPANSITSQVLLQKIGSGCSENSMPPAQWPWRCWAQGRASGLPQEGEPAPQLVGCRPEETRAPRTTAAAVQTEQKQTLGQEAWQRDLFRSETEWPHSLVIISQEEMQSVLVSAAPVQLLHGKAKHQHGTSNAFCQNLSKGTKNPEQLQGSGVFCCTWLFS